MPLLDLGVLQESCTKTPDILSCWLSFTFAIKVMATTKVNVILKDAKDWLEWIHEHRLYH
jgi:hypothetical protein